MGSKSDDPRSVAEKARADLKANNEMGLAPPESPAMERPSVTPKPSGRKRASRTTRPGRTTTPCRAPRNEPTPQDDVWRPTMPLAGLMDWVRSKFGSGETARTKRMSAPVAN
jgi:hypothetical protein